MVDVPLAKLPIAVSDIAATGTADPTTYLRGDGSWSTPAGAGGGSGLLVAKAYGTASATLPSTSSAIFADINTANLAVTFTAPASGRVLVALEAAADISNTQVNGYVWRVANGGVQVGYAVSAGRESTMDRRRVTILANVTAGTSYTLTWQHAVAAGTGRLTIDDGSTGVNAWGPAVMEVWSA